jgi:hypothetical protein
MIKTNVVQNYVLKDRGLNNFPILVPTLRVSLGTRMGGKLFNFYS